MRAVLWLFACLLVLTGCLEDAPVAPQIAPIEIVARSAGSDRGAACSLNRDEVAAGVHDVIVLAEGDATTVRITAADGSRVLESRARADGAASTSVDLAEGEYGVECTWSSGEQKATFRVTG